VSRVFIVGASRGIGLEFVHQYRQDGAEVWATARDEAGLARIAALGAHVLRLDVTHASAARAPEGLPAGAAFDVAVFNAGVYGPRTAALVAPSQADFDDVMRTNVLGAMQVLPWLVDRLAPGGVLGVVSSKMGSMGLRTSPAGSLYRASKAALNSVLKDASLAVAGRATCVALHPGWVRTDMGGAGADLDVRDSVAQLRRTLAGLKPADNGGFFNHDGAPLAW
jgi:NAD(P)-dependent dehydrogenase (short-subunit alcohol dehydrogenase family)